MLRVHRQPVPLDYSKCDQTVTVYHLQAAEKKVYRVVISGAHLEQKRRQDNAKTGCAEQSGFLLVIPQGRCRYLSPDAFTGAAGTYTLANQDKVMPGEGPQITCAEWPAFIPAKVPGLCVVGQVAPQLWAGALCHMEASE